MMLCKLFFCKILCKTNENDMSFFALPAIAGNGDGHIIAAFLVVSEDEVTLRQMIPSL